MSRKDWTNEKLFTRLLNNKSDKTYWQNIGELRSRPNSEVFATSIKLTKSNKFNERIIGIDILAQLGISPRPFYKKTIKCFFSLLKNESNEKVLSSLLFAIGHNNENLNKSQVGLISSYKNHINVGVRQGLVFAIGGVSNPLAVRTLIFLSDDKFSSIRNWATFGIGSLTEENSEVLRDALWERVKDAHQETKLEAILGLAKRKDSRVKEIIKKEIINGEFGIVLLEAIDEFKDKQFLPLLKQNLLIAKNNKNINPEWLKEFEAFIKKYKLIKNIR